MSRRRVAVTGIGAVTPVGIGVDAFWQGLLAPQPATSQRRVEDFDPEQYFDNPKEARRADRFTQLALAAATEALAQAGTFTADPTRIGAWVGTGVGGIDTLEAQIVVCHTKGPKRVSPFLVPMMMANACGAAISMRYGLQGPNETVFFDA